MGRRAPPPMPRPSGRPIQRWGRRTGRRPTLDSMSNATEIIPDVAHSDTGDSDGYAHYARSEEILRANVEGGLVTALCGYKFAPVRDPQRFPVCPKCKELVDLANEFG